MYVKGMTFSCYNSDGLIDLKVIATLFPNTGHLRYTVPIVRDTLKCVANKE